MVDRMGEIQKRGKGFSMETIRSYEDMENYVRKQIEGSWDFIDPDVCGFTVMRVGIQGKHEMYYASAIWYAGEEAEERTHEKAKLEAESFFEITYEDAVSMQYSMDLEEVEKSEMFFRRMEENVDDFWEDEYMAAMDEPETEVNIKFLADDLWRQWKEDELND